MAEKEKASAPYAATTASAVSVAAPCAVPGTPLASARAGIDACVHCGFCLQACPTYVNLQDENDSPRGRILLMRSVLEGSLALDDPSVQTHIDRCLGCRGCETACPSGVPYGQLLEATRATLAERRPPPRIARLVLSVFRHPALLAMAMRMSRLARATRIPAVMARILGGRLSFATGMLASTTPSLRTREWTPAGNGSRGTVALLEGCVMEGLFAHTNRATERTLAHNDYAMVPAAGQGCCGALHAHSGSLDGARALAKRNIEAFERSGARYVVTNAAGCGAMMKEYGHLLHDDPKWAARAQQVAERVRDVSELLAEAGPKPAGELRLTVTYDAPCHLLHAQRVQRPPLAVLGAIGGMTLVPLTDSDQCCGAAGIYNLIEPETSDAVLTPKLRHIAETKADWVATGNPGCHMQIGAGLIGDGSRTRVIHPVELLDAAYGEQLGKRAGAGLSDGTRTTAARRHGGSSS